MSFADNYGSPPNNGRNNREFSLDVYGGRNQQNQYNNRSADIVNTVTNQIRQLSNNVMRIEKITQQLGSYSDNGSLRDELNDLIITTRELAKDVTENVRILDSDKSPDKKIVQQKLTKDLSIWVKRYQECYKVAIDKERNTPIPQPKPQQKSYGRNKAYNDDEEEKQGLMDSHNRSEAQFRMMNQADFNHQLIHDRDQDIKQIADSVVQINEIFRDVNALVMEQGEMIDSIESNIEQTRDHTEKATEELTKASTYQKKSRTKLCCLAVIILVVLAVAGVLIYLFASKII